MFIRLNAASAVPIYRQIVDQVRYQVATGALRPGDRLPSVRDLARRLTTNQNTILKVYDQLAAEGIAERRQGDGTFVASAKPMLPRGERAKRLRASLSHAAVEARLFQIATHDVHEILDEEIQSITKELGEAVGD